MLKPTPEECCSRGRVSHTLNSGEALGLVGTRPQPSSLPQKLSIKWSVRKEVSKNGSGEGNTLRSQEANKAGRFLISVPNMGRSPSILRSMGGRLCSGEAGSADGS